MRSDNALIVDIEVTLEEEARVFVEYRNEQAGAFRTRTTEPAATSHTIPLVRLRPETTYEYEVVVLDAGNGERGRVQGQFTTGPLPERLAELEFTSEGRPTPELILMDILEGEGKGYMVAIDQESHIVWYYTGTEGHLRGIKQKANYNLVFLEGGFGIREITPLGEEVANLPDSRQTGNSHHDLLAMPDDKIVYLTNVRQDTTEEMEGIPAGTQITAIAIREWDQKTGEVRIVWDMFDFTPVNKLAAILNETVNLNPPSAHGNSLYVGPRGNILVSFRHTNQVMSITPDWKELEWRLGGPDSDFSFPDPSDKFYHQHTAIELDGNRILVFDNGNTRPPEEGGEYSRGLELALDYDTMTARKVWEYRHDPDIFARSISGVEDLPNGNVLVNFGRSQDLSRLPITLVEVSPEGEVTWKSQTSSPILPRRYRAYAFDSLLGEVRLK